MFHFNIDVFNLICFVDFFRLILVINDLDDLLSFTFLEHHNSKSQGTSVSFLNVNLCNTCCSFQKRVFFFYFRHRPMTKRFSQCNWHGNKKSLFFTVLPNKQLVIFSWSYSILCTFISRELVCGLYCKYVLQSNL